MKKHQLTANDYVIIQTKEQAETIFACADLMGIPVYSASRNSEWPKPGRTISFGSGEITGAGTPSINGDGKIISFDQFVAKIMGVSKPTSIEVKLNEDYSATVTKEFVKVGCQKFEHAKIKELYYATVKIDQP